MKSLSITVRLPEGRIAADLAGIQLRHPQLSIGSYPFFTMAGSLADMRASVGTTLVIRGRDEAAVEAAGTEIETMIRTLGAVPERQAETTQ